MSSYKQSPLNGKKSFLQKKEELQDQEQKLNLYLAQSWNYPFDIRKNEIISEYLYNSEEEQKKSEERQTKQENDRQARKIDKKTKEYKQFEDLVKKLS